MLIALMLLAVDGRLTISNCPNDVATFIEPHVSSRISEGEHIVIVCRDTRVSVSSARGTRSFSRIGRSTDALGPAVYVALSSPVPVADVPRPEPQTTATASVPASEPIPPRPRVRGYFLQSFGATVSLSRTGTASYREWTNCVIDRPDCPRYRTGSGERRIPLLVLPQLLNIELGIVIDERVRIAADLAALPLHAIAHIGLDVGRVLETRPDRFGTFTLWLGAGYAHRSFFDMSGSQLLGGLVSVRATFEYKAGYFIIRPELFAHLQLVNVFDDDNYGEGNYYSFSGLPTVQLGFKLGIGVNWPR